MNISDKGIQLIKSFEGCRLQEYKDIGCRYTIGYGHLIKPGESFPEGITEEQAESILTKDVNIVVTFLNSLNLNLNQNQFDALCSFCFNLGMGSTKTMLKHGIEEVPTQILRWDRVNNNIDNVLLNRRREELALWLKQ